MAFSNNLIFFVVLVICSNLGKCAEFVPVYMWGTGKLSEHVPALHKTSGDSFKDTLLEYLKKDPYILVFAEHTLSPEDFSQRDQNGEIAFPNILNLKKESHVTYKPYVQNPIGAVKQLDRPVTELSIGSLLDSPNVPKDNILIIDLNDAKDDEQRFHMLKRHDSDIVSIYKDILEQHKNILVIYTAYHTSWVAPEEVTHKKSRILLATEDPPTNSTTVPVVYQFESTFLLYLTSEGTIYAPSIDNASLDQTWTANVTKNENNTIYSLVDKTGGNTINFIVTEYDKGYWYLKSVEIATVKNTSLLAVSNIFAPVRFSYHCGDLVLRGTDANLTLPGFQIQVFNASESNNTRFGDAYDCVGFTSVPIWSALFVTAILLFIMTFGLTMMMDIKTMDRFDDAKGKTITINASE